MEPYYEDSHVTIYHADCREVLPELDPVDTCITDPPYGLRFMGRAWDHEVPDETYWKLVRETVKPGGMCLAFGGTRLWHWLAVGLERAGWEIRDTLMWLYGQGFPKSHDISKAIDEDAGAEREVTGTRMGDVGIQGGNFANKSERGVIVERDEPATDAAKKWDGWGTALKPGWEPIILAMNPLDGTFAENAREHGVAGLNIDGARLEVEEDDPNSRSGRPRPYEEHGSDFGASGKRGDWHPSGRWPANVVLDEDAAGRLDGQSAPKMHGAGHETDTTPNAARWDPSNAIAYGMAGHAFRYGDSGGASRFFYTSKASRSDRGPGNDHPTVKPSDLMKWLCTLTRTPDGGTVLDPFMGSGTTLLAAKETGRKAIGIETEEKWCEVAAERLSQGVLDLGGAA